MPTELVAVRLVDSPTLTLDPVDVPDVLLDPLLLLIPLLRPVPSEVFQPEVVPEFCPPLATPGMPPPTLEPSEVPLLDPAPVLAELPDDVPLDELVPSEKLDPLVVELPVLTP